MTKTQALRTAARHASERKKRTGIFAAMDRRAYEWDEAERDFNYWYDKRRWEPIAREAQTLRDNNAPR